MNIRERNIEVFKDTRSLSLGTYAADTDLMLSDVRVYSEPAKLTAVKRRNAPIIKFMNKSTVAAALECSRSPGHIGVLNFADAITPGGLVEYGEVTQEESLCRCSNLYEGLILSRCLANYYGYNRETGNSIYSDRLIYSPNVLFFKHDSTHTEIDTPFHADVITCPSPSCQCDSDILIHRIKGILSAAGNNKVDSIILGAWGCGAFGQDAEEMGRCFGVALKECNYFKRVYFAIITVVRATDDGNLFLFKSGFRETYDSSTEGQL